jgi:small subunit ribosomal protein S6
VSSTTYETVFIAEPDISSDQVDQLIAKITQTITAHKGSITAEDRWGKRRMAYPIGGHREGFYTVISFTAEAGAVQAIEHLYNVTDAVIRHLTTRIIKKNKTFPPRRERPAGEAAGARHGSRYAGPSRPRSEGASAAKAPASTPAAPETAPVTTPAHEPSQGGTSA